MLNFYKLYGKVLSETIADKDALWNYFNFIKTNPNVDDLRTLVKMIEKKYHDTENTGMIADFLGSIKSNIIPNLSETDQEEAQRIISGLKVHPRTELYMLMHGHKKFNNLNDFEEFINKSIERGNATAAVKIAMQPENIYWWEMTSHDIKEELRNAIVAEHERIKNQPSIADIIRKHMKENKPEGESN